MKCLSRMLYKEYLPIVLALVFLIGASNLALGDEPYCLCELPDVIFLYSYDTCSRYPGSCFPVLADHTYVDIYAASPCILVDSGMSGGNRYLLGAQLVNWWWYHSWLVGDISYYLPPPPEPRPGEMAFYCGGNPGDYYPVMEYDSLSIIAWDYDKEEYYYDNIDILLVLMYAGDY